MFKNEPPLFGVLNHAFFGFSILSRQSVSGSLLGFVWGGVGRALMHCMHFSAIFVVLAVFGDLGDPVVPTLGV